MRFIISVVLLLVLISCGAETKLSVENSNKKVPEQFLDLPEVLEIKREVFRFSEEKNNKLSISKRTYLKAIVQNADRVSHIYRIPYNSSTEDIKIHSVKVWKQGQRNPSHIRSFSDKNIYTESFYSSLMAKVFSFPYLENQMRYEIDYEIKYKEVNALDPISLMDHVPVLNYKVSIANHTSFQIDFKPTGNVKLAIADTIPKKVGPQSQVEFNLIDVAGTESLKEYSIKMDHRPFLHFFIDSKEFITTWADVANHFFDLNKENYVISDSVYHLIKAEIDSPDPDQYVKNVYKYVQKNIRYEALVDGVKAYKADTPETVLNNKYGECKSVSMLLVSLLRKKGMEASPAILSAKIDAYNFEYPKLYMANHVIAYAKVENKEYWLDATSSYSSADYNLGLNSDRNVLIVHGDSNFLYKKTPVINFNNEKLKWEFHLENTEQNLVGKGSVSYSGEQAIKMRNILFSASTKDREELLSKFVQNALENAELTNVHITKNDNFDRPFIIQFDIKLNNVVSQFMDRKIITLNPISYLKNSYYTTKDHSGRFYLSAPYTEEVIVSVKRDKNTKLYKPINKYTEESDIFSFERELIEEASAYTLKLTKNIKTQYVSEDQNKHFFAVRKKMKSAFDFKLQLKE